MLCDYVYNVVVVSGDGGSGGGGGVAQKYELVKY